MRAWQPGFPFGHRIHYTFAAAVDGVLWGTAAKASDARAPHVRERCSGLGRARTRRGSSTPRCDPSMAADSSFIVGTPQRAAATAADDITAALTNVTGPGRRHAESRRTPGAQRDRRRARCRVAQGERTCTWAQYPACSTGQLWIVWSCPTRPRRHVQAPVSCTSSTIALSARPPAGRPLSCAVSQQVPLKSARCSVPLSVHAEADAMCTIASVYAHKAATFQVSSGP